VVKEFSRQTALHGGAADFSRGKVNATPTSREQNMQSALAVALMSLLCLFAAYNTTAVIHNAFQWAGQPRKIAASPREILTHLIHGSLGQTESPTQTASGIIQPFL